MSDRHNNKKRVNLSIMAVCPHCKVKLERDFILKAASWELSAMWHKGERDEIWKYIPPELGVGLAASITSRLRTVKKGQAPVLRVCPGCNQKFAAREMRVHWPRCPKRVRSSKYKPKA